MSTFEVCPFYFPARCSLYCMHLFLCVDLCSGQAATGPRIIRQADQVCLVFEAALHIYSVIFSPVVGFCTKRPQNPCWYLAEKAPLETSAKKPLNTAAARGRGACPRLCHLGWGKSTSPPRYVGSSLHPSLGTKGCRFQHSQVWGVKCLIPSRGGRNRTLLSSTRHQGLAQLLEGVGHPSSVGAAVNLGWFSPGLHSLGSERVVWQPAVGRERSTAGAG